MGDRTYPWPPAMGAAPSPDWREPLWAKRLQYDVAAMARKVTSPPAGVDWEDFMQEVRLILMIRAWSPGSQWRPERAAWTSWCCMVIKTFSQNYHKRHRRWSPGWGEPQDVSAIAGTSFLLPTLSEQAPELLGVDEEPIRPRRTVFPKRSNPLEGY